MSRYVTVKRKSRDLGPDEFGAIQSLPWSRWECVCGVKGGKYDHGEAVTSADRHARRCPTVRIATERDELADVAAEYPRMVDKVVKERDRYKAALESCEAAYAAEVKELKAERDDYRKAES